MNFFLFGKSFHRFYGTYEKGKMKKCLAKKKCLRRRFRTSPHRTEKLELRKSKRWRGKRRGITKTRVLCVRSQLYSLTQLAKLTFHGSTNMSVSGLG